MSRLDRHVAAVRRKLGWSLLLDSAAWCAAGVAAIVLVAILVDRFVHIGLPAWMLWTAMGAGAVATVAWTIVRMPGRHEAAVEIDAALSLKEKFSTALYVRNSRDVFAQAAVRDAENAADQVNVAGKFPLKYPRQATYAAAIALLALGASLLKPINLFGDPEVERRKELQKQIAAESARQVVKDAKVSIASIAEKMGPSEAVELARRAIENLDREPIRDPSRTKLTAAQVLQDLKDQLKDEKDKVQKRAVEAQKEAAKMFEAVAPGPNEKGAVADARRSLAKGDFAGALAEIEKAVENFDKMDKKEKDEAAEQMGKLAKQLEQMAKDQQQQQQMEDKLQQQLQKMGQNQQQAQQQAKQMAQCMQQAAAGNQQAAQQLQQMAQQAAQQSQQQGNPQAQQLAQQLQQAMAQGQANANAQCQAGQLAQGAGQMAQAMQQAGQGNPGQQGMNQAQQNIKQAMQNAMAQMQGVQQAANADQAQRQAANAARQAAGQCGGGDGQGKDGQGQAQAGGQGQWGQGDPNQQGGGQGGPGIGAGGNTGREQAPFGVVRADSPTHHDPSGRLISSALVKDGIVVKGENSAKMKEVAQAGQKEQTDEVDDTRADKKTAEMMKRYFKTMEKDAEGGK